MRTATQNQVAISNGVQLRTAREEAYAEFQAHQGVDKLSKQLSNMSDVLLMNLWSQCQLHDDAALLAVGGYGRSELFPYSDVDILILLPDHESETLSARVEQFIAQ
jgi:[protein-PII] uridylyltransferase